MKDQQSAELPSPKFPHPPKRVPWWVSVLLAIGSYCTLKFLVPELSLANATLQKLAQAAPTFAPLAAIPFLLLAAKQLYDSDIVQKEPDRLDGDEKPEE